ncbi:response regulator [Aeoliella mucimassa]|uniref:Hydrogenase transcriptional regulatory protein hupR1 n=1 Tax=Aeoliella mucimassa TaxID=2527972 RepID=A0A518AR27_9BACT|nr:response regulator [Aeoliella mucimassa]QDU57169.1 Hydrogenase transcriptional regulatory protein hupR1 [Aeoliella mucimassa]
MSERLLIVDDEQPLLNGLRRRLGDYYDLVTANSGDAALHEIETHGEFAVVLTDMRMPGMNGIQFIQQARMIAPDSVYMMLTGNQDQATAIKAVNDGQVFRFLNKPCDHDHIRRALDAGLDQYRLITAERVLLHKTFSGAVGVLTDVLEIVQPEIFSRSNEIQTMVDNLRAAINATDRWEYKLAARLGIVGFALLPDDKRHKLETCSPDDPELQEILAASAATGARLLEKIPRLGTIASMIRESVNVDGSCTVSLTPQEEEVIHTGATLLRIAMQWNCLSRIGMSNKDAMVEMRQLLPQLHKAFVEELERTHIDTEHLAPVCLSVEELEEGMVLYNDVMTRDDSRLLRKGQRLSGVALEKLLTHYGNLLASDVVMVYASSCSSQIAQMAANK